MKIIPLAFLGAFTFLSFAQQTQNVKQQIEQIIQQGQKEIKEQFSDHQLHSKQFLQVEAEVNRILSDLPDNIGLPPEQIQQIVLRFFLQNNPESQNFQEKIRKYFKHIVQEHKEKFETFGKDLPDLPEQQDEERFKTIENQIEDEIPSQQSPQGQGEGENNQEASQRKEEESKSEEEESIEEEQAKEEEIPKEEQSNQQGEEEIEDKP